MKRIGLALGGGGARGLAHVVFLELLDELGIRPKVIAGTSMGAIIGALYASGMSGKEIKERIRRHIVTKNDSFKNVLEKKKEILKWLDGFRLEMGRGGLIKTDRFLGYLFKEIQKTSFEELEIPLLVIATDYWEAEEVVFQSGPLLPAINASMAVPGVFTPVQIDGRVLVDGGAVNNVPYDHLKSLCDVSIAIDVRLARLKKKHMVPHVFDSVLGVFDIMSTSIMVEKMKYQRPDIYIKPVFNNIRIFDFEKVDEIFEQAQNAVKDLRSELLKKVIT